MALENLKLKKEKSKKTRSGTDFARVCLSSRKGSHSTFGESFVPLASGTFLSFFVTSNKPKKENVEEPGSR